MTKQTLRDLDDQNDLDRFFELKAEIERLTEELSAVKERIIYAVIGEPDQKFQYGDELLYLQNRPSYDWDAIPEIAEANAHLKALKEIYKSRAPKKKEQLVLMHKFNPVEVARR